MGFSDRSETAGFKCDYEPDEFPPALFALAARRPPKLLDVDVAGGWSGHYEVTPADNQIIGGSDSPSRFLYATGFSGPGLVMAPAAGGIIRDLYLGRPPPIDRRLRRAPLRERWTQGRRAGDHLRSATTAGPENRTRRVPRPRTAPRPMDVSPTASESSITGWATLVAGRPAERDRPAEFTVSGPVMDLIEREEAMKRRLRQDLIAADRPAALRTAGCLPGHHARPHLGAALLRGDEELARHQGQLESTRDAIRQHHTGPAGD